METSDYHRMISAGIGATITSLTMTPFDVIKTRMQAHSNNVHGTMNNALRIIQKEGITSLWKGLTPTLALTVPSTMMYYIAYERLRDRLEPNGYAPLLSGAIARTMTVFISSPLELLRTRVQSSGPETSLASTVKSIQVMIQQNGVSSLWRGTVPTLWRDVPFSGHYLFIHELAIYWISYEYLKKRFKLMSEKTRFDNEFSISFGSGALSGMIAAFITTPFDVAKTLRQVSVIHEQQGMFQLLIHVYTKQGIQGLFLGLSPRIAKVSPACAIMISSYEVGKVYFSH